WATAQCSATFSYTTNGLTTTFTGIVSPAQSASANYYWWFDDNSSSSMMQNPVYTFSAPGTYMVCFSVYNASSNCMDSLCLPVMVTSSGCSADFTWSDTTGSTYFTGTSTVGAGAAYLWDFGDGNYSSQQSPVHSYATAGTYTVCLTVYDSLQQFCDSTCYTVTAQGSGGCIVDFTWIDSLGYVFYITSSTLGSNGYYSWDFGDGNYSTAMNPSHVYATNGTYYVCVTVYDSNQVFCDSTCYWVSAQSQVGTMDVNTVQQTLAVSPNPGDDALNVTFTANGAGTVKIMLYDVSGRMAKEEAISLQGAGEVNHKINTSDMAEGVYFIKIEVNGVPAWTKITLTHQ
ncbi:MAG TPA: PKD domain-containing protein, partial [Bacteroidia bacterium]|nr:PKD domain-containing protein [Bacteroidia bacterium]